MRVSEAMLTNTDSKRYTAVNDAA